MARLSDERIAENMAKVQKIVSLFPDPRKKQVAKMLMGPIGEEFFTAPASGKEEYHCCFPGGLCDHSLRVVENLHALAQALCPGKYSVDTLDFVGLFHDLGKAGDGDQPNYVPNDGPDDAWKRKRGWLYETNRKAIFMDIEDRSTFVLQKYGIELTPEEYLAIRLSDGQYVEANRRYAMKEPDLALLLHFADRWATSQEKANL